MGVLPFQVMAQGNQRTEPAELLHHIALEVLPGDSLDPVLVQRVLSPAGVVVRKAAENRILPDSAGPQAVQGLVAAVIVQIPVVGEVHHLHPVTQFSGVIGQHSGKKQLLIVAVGGEEHQIRGPLHGSLPLLDPVRQFSIRKQIQLVKRHRSPVEGNRDPLLGLSKKGRQIHQRVEKLLLPRFFFFSMFTGDPKGRVFRIKNQVQIPQPLRVLQGKPGMVLGFCSLVLFPVK